MKDGRPVGRVKVGTSVSDSSWRSTRDCGGVGNVKEPVGAGKVPVKPEGKPVGRENVPVKEWWERVPV